MRLRNRQCIFCLTDKEYSKLQKKLEISGLNMSAFIRKLIDNVEIKARLPSEFSEVQRLLANISNNINQIAHVTNATNNIHYEQVETLSRQVDKMYDHLMSLG